MRARVHFQALVFLAALFPTCLWSAANDRVRVESFESGGQQIRADIFEPPTAKSRHAILVLHGAGGTIFDGPEMRRVAQALADDGNTVYLIHYFNRTGTLFARDATMQKNFSAWLDTVRDSIAWVQTKSKDHAPVGIYGYSLGGFLALAAASDNPRVGAVVEQAGGVWNGKKELIGKMPAVLVVHGKADRRVPFQKYAVSLIALLRRRGTNFETSFFQGEGHIFSQAAMTNVKKGAINFFRRAPTKI